VEVVLGLGLGLETRAGRVLTRFQVCSFVGEQK
jgi:hypothetical protein